MTNKENFDVLTIAGNREDLDIIQTLMGHDCLGAFFRYDSAKLYFNKGLREKMNRILNEFAINEIEEWQWEIQSHEEWHLTWKENFQPIIIDEKLAIIPHWQENSKEDLVIKIKPGMAFGTGHHETTWLMLKQMLSYIQEGMSVLDLGTGSGILSITAKIMGATKVDAIEIDSVCETNFYENLKLNKIKEGINFYREDILNWGKWDYDLVLGNINRNIIEKLIPKLLNVKGKILLSGLLISDFDLIKTLGRKYKFQLNGKLIKGEWICIIISFN